MKINVYPLVSSLHNQDTINETTRIFLNKLEELTSCYFEIVKDIDSFYENSDLSIILVQTGGSENYFLRDFNKIKPPFYILTYGFSNSLAAAIEILSFINSLNLKGEILHGSENYISQRLLSILKEVEHE